MIIYFTGIVNGAGPGSPFELIMGAAAPGRAYPAMLRPPFFSSLRGSSPLPLPISCFWGVVPRPAAAAPSLKYGWLCDQCCTPPHHPLNY